ncbi:vegetative cell wall protein GP1-like protein [Tanacetum coccineum]
MPSWVSLMVLVLCFSLNVVSDAHGHRKHLRAPAVLVGTVYCDTCFHQEVSKTKSSHFIPGATVAVECGSHIHGKQSFRQEVKTNKKGEFEAKLPLSVSKSLDKIKACSVKLLSSGSPYCSVAAAATSSQIHYKSKTAGKHIFSAGFFTFKPELCNQKDFVGKDFPPALPDPAAPFLPPVGGGIIPTLPVPDIPIPPVIPPLVPPLPRLPGVPLPPISRQKSLKNDHLSDQKTFGFPFPPPVLPPLPLVPSPPSLIPPVLPTPPPASFFPPLPFPPLPGLIPSPPPPPPAFPIPLPPLPPVPGFPGIPPASKKTTP